MHSYELYGLNLYKNWDREAFLRFFLKEIEGHRSNFSGLSISETGRERTRQRARPVLCPGGQEEFLKGLVVKNAFGFDHLTLMRGARDRPLQDRLDYDAAVKAVFGFDIFSEWHNHFSFDEHCLKYIPSRGVDPRLKEFSQRIDPRGLKVLELGCLEGHHSIDLQSMGAAEVIAIEGRKENFLKSLVVKNAFELDRCTFLLGDIKNVLKGFSATFDICVALGILYHFKEPFPVIRRIAELSNAVFVWMHYSDQESSEAPLEEVEYYGKKYRGRYLKEDIQYRLDGLEGQAFRIFEEDIPRAFRDAGFSDVEILSKENTDHGPAVTLLAKKS